MKNFLRALFLSGAAATTQAMPLPTDTTAAEVSRQVNSITLPVSSGVTLGIDSSSQYGMGGKIQIE